jgi:hypothetical protein
MAKKETEVKKPSGKAWKIIGFILGLIAILLCLIPVLNIISLIFSVIGIVISVVGIRRSEKKSFAFSALILNIISLCISIIILLLFGGVLWLLSGGNPSSIISSGTANYTNYTLGETILLGNISIIVLSADKTTQIENNQNQTIPITTAGDFLSIKMIIENHDTETITWSGDPFLLDDNSGRVFAASSKAESYYPNSISTNTQLQPGVPFNAIKIFEIPQNSTGLKLDVLLYYRQGGKVGAYIDLGK